MHCILNVLVHRGKGASCLWGPARMTPLVTHAPFFATEICPNSKFHLHAPFFATEICPNSKFHLHAPFLLTKIAPNLYTKIFQKLNFGPNI